MSDNNDMIQQVTAAFQATIATMSAQHEKEVNALNERIKELTAQVAWLNRQLFGRKSEKLPIYDPNYPDLFADQFASINKDAEEKRNEVVEKLLMTNRQEPRNVIIVRYWKICQFLSGKSLSQKKAWI